VEGGRSEGVQGSSSPRSAARKTNTEFGRKRERSQDVRDASQPSIEQRPPLGEPTFVFPQGPSMNVYHRGSGLHRRTRQMSYGEAEDEREGWSATEPEAPEVPEAPSRRSQEGELGLDVALELDGWIKTSLPLLVPQQTQTLSMFGSRAKTRIKKAREDSRTRSTNGSLAEVKRKMRQGSYWRIALRVEPSRRPGDHEQTKARTSRAIPDDPEAEKTASSEDRTHREWRDYRQPKRSRRRNE